MKLFHSFTLPFAWERIAQVLCDPQFNIERDKQRDGVIASAFQMLEERERYKLFELRTTEYRRSMTGALNRRGTVATVTTFRYDSEARTVGWHYSGEAGRLLELSGIYRLQPRDGGTLLAHEVTILVWIPVLGYFLTQLIAQEFEKPAQDYRQLIIEYAEAIGTSEKTGGATR
ncbi:MAG: hypothetical protein ACFCVA_06215 [Gammaproteobacteria bacterium]